jgi:hygromycin-B 7''-O-kinase
MRLLPEVKDQANFEMLFKQNDVWKPAISYLSKLHGLKGEIQRGVLGSHVVYRVGDRWIKLMAPIYRKDMPFEISGLKAVYGNLSVPTPEILVEGDLDGWAYVVLSHIEGDAIRNVWPAISADQRVQLTRHMAQILLEIRACKPDSTIKGRFDWNSFINEQYSKCEILQKRKKVPDSWFKTVANFLGKFSVSEFECDSPVFIHADLTYDHFLVTLEPEVKISGIIDMADCQVGHFEYELATPSTFILKDQRELLRNFFLGCGYCPSVLNHKFSEKLMAWALLHRYFNMASFLKDEMNKVTPGDFESLAQLVYPLE